MSEKNAIFAPPLRGDPRRDLPTRTLLVLLGLLLLAALASTPLPRPQPSPWPTILLYHQLREWSPDDGPGHLRTVCRPADFESQITRLARRGYIARTMLDVAKARDLRRPIAPRIIAITFDDGWETDWTVAAPILERHGFRASFYIVPSLVGQPGRLTWDQVRALHARGHEIGAHSLTHPHLSQLSQDAACQEIIGSREQIERAIGAPCETFAYPFGDVSPSVIELARNAGFRAGLGVDDASREPLWLRRSSVLFGQRALPGEPE